MLKKHALFLLQILLLNTVSLPAMNEPPPASILFETDRAFSSRAQEIGVPAAFLEYAAEDAVIYRNGMPPVVGKEAIRKLMESDPPATLVWEPVAADMAESGDLGYTRGSFVYHLKAGPDGKASGPFKGHYVSIWKKQADGSWKWVFDGGILSEMPEATVKNPGKQD